MKLRKILSLSLVLALCAGLLIVPAGASDMGKVGENSFISAGGHCTAAIDANGSLWMWGETRYSQLGPGIQGDARNKSNGNYMQTVPVKVLENMTAVNRGDERTLAIDKNGDLWMWGRKMQFVDGIPAPVKILDNVAAASCGGGHYAAIRTDGSLWMWGYNSVCQFGNDSIEFTPVPVKVRDNVAAVSCGQSCTAVIDKDGSLWMWGLGYYGQVGNGSDGSRVPVKILDNVIAVSCGNSHTAAIQADGSLWTWGYNCDGQLGNGGGGNAQDKALHKPYQTVPVKVMENAVAVSCGNSHTAAIQANGSLWMWGSNFLGQLGNGTTEGSPVPVKVLENVVAVSCGTSHTIACKADGSLWTWGHNIYGELGNGSGGNRKDSLSIWQTVPVQITLGGGAAMSKGVRLDLNGGVGGGTLWTNAAGTVQVPTNPTKEGYTFGGWYTDAALTIPWNFNDQVTDVPTLYAKWNSASSTAATTAQSTQKISLNGTPVDIQGYTLKAGNGGDVTYVKLRDIAALLDGTAAQFNVDWRSGAIYVDAGTAYTSKNGTELKAITRADESYKWNTAPVLFSGETKALEGIVITDAAGGGHTFFKLRDLGAAVGFNVGWDADRGIYIETDKPYAGAN